MAATVANQPFGRTQVRTVIPRLRRGERGTAHLSPADDAARDLRHRTIEVTRRDPFDLFRVSRRHGRTERIWVYPRVLGFHPLPAGQTRHLEGPSSDTSPQGNITFHRLRDYVVGDDLRLVHWRSSARTGTLVVKHNVDTSQPYSVVVLDQRPGRYTEEAFESAVDVAASVLVASSANKAPVELRLTDCSTIGGPRLREVTPLIDHLTGIDADPDGSLQASCSRCAGRVAARHWSSSPAYWIAPTCPSSPRCAGASNGSWSCRSIRIPKPSPRISRACG